MTEYHSNRQNPAEQRWAVFQWTAEFPKQNYDRCAEMATLILNNVPENKKRIVEIGQRINDEGGMTAMVAVYYILTNFFLPPCDNRRTDLYIVKYHWNGVGEWLG
jgi:hypothetical protein